MKTILHLLGILIYAITLNASIRGPAPGTHFSENKSFKLVLNQESKNEGSRISTDAKLYRIDPDGNESLLWERKLINDRTPYSFYISNDGEYTLAFSDQDERGIGYLTIYDEEGNLKEIISSQKFYANERFDTREQGVAFFGEDGLFFYILNMEGFVTVINLPSGFIYTNQTAHIIQHDDEILKSLIWHQHYAYERARDICMKYLESDDTLWANRQGIKIAVMLHNKEAIPHLRNFLTSTEYHTYDRDGVETKQYYLRKAAKNGLNALGVEVSGDIIIYEPK